MKSISAINPARCMKCGFCMSVCPIYNHDRMETHVARGRNMLIHMAAQHQLPRDNAYRASLSYCLLCRRCESVCLAGLSPAEITIHARHALNADSKPSLPKRVINRAMVGNRAFIAKLVGMAAVLPGISNHNGKPMRHLVEAASLLSGNLLLPKGALPSFFQSIPRHTQAAAGVSAKGRIAIFPGCAFEFFMAEMARDMISALARAGFEVFFPQGLSCCGQAVYSEGDFKTARLMAERNIRVLSNFDRVVTGCATCGSALKGYAGWFEKDSVLHCQAADLSRKSFDFTEVLAEVNFQVRGAALAGQSVTYHDPCHMRWHQGISEAPRRLLQSIRGISYREMDGADACCGLGGAFGLAHRQIGLRLLDEKMSAIRKSGAQTVVTACPGCLMHLKAGAKRHHLPVRVVHISKLMAGTAIDVPHTPI